MMQLKLVTTLWDSGKVKTRQERLPMQEDWGAEDRAINLYPDVEMEAIEGFGGAITDSAAYVYSLMDAQQKRTLMERYFSPEQMAYGLVRIHMDSCDFSTGLYEAMSDPTDTDLRSFSFARTEKYILPMLADAQKAAEKKLELMLSPWSPPAFMKTNESRTHGGSLKPAYRQMWADYICRYIKEFESRGFTVRRISLQNEPKAVQTWDSCVYTGQEEKEFLRDYMYPTLQRNGLGHIEIFVWDHNKERVYERMCQIADPVTLPMITGAAFHWYSGDHFEALELIRRQFPGKKLIVSESCIEYSKYDSADTARNAGRLSHEIIGDLNHGMTAFYDWNILLDEQGGPNYVGNFCQAPFLYDRQKKELIPQLLSHHIWHFSHFLTPGSRRIGWSRYAETVDVTAYKRPDGTLTFVLLNRENTEKQLHLRVAGQLVLVTLPPMGLVTGILKDEP